MATDNNLVTAESAERVAILYYQIKMLSADVNYINMPIYSKQTCYQTKELKRDIDFLYTLFPNGDFQKQFPNIHADIEKHKKDLENLIQAEINKVSKKKTLKTPKS